MLRPPLGLRIPEGMRDLLPDELSVQERLESEILSLFQQWSYQKVLTPTLEFGACIQPDLMREDNFFKFFNGQGNILVLRPEMTTSIARLVSTRLRGTQLPLRLCYSGDVLRNSPGRQREFRQLGVELIGAASGLADAEVIALAVESIQHIGVSEFQFNLGHMGIFNGLMSEAGIDGELRSQLENALARKDMVLAEGLLQENSLPENMRELLLRLPHLRGQEEILDEILAWSKSPAIREAVEELRAIYGYLKDFGVEHFVSLDLGILRRFSYYTGVIFEGYVPGIGFPAVEGGRYDNLYADFGYPLPATGFAIHLGSLLGQFSSAAADNADMLVYGSDPQRMIRRCKELRAKGKKVEMALDTLSREEAQELAEKKRISLLVSVD